MIPTTKNGLRSVPEATTIIVLPKATMWAVSIENTYIEYKYIIANNINRVKGSIPIKLLFIDSEIHDIKPVLFNPVARVNNPPNQINVSHAL